LTNEVSVLFSEPKIPQCRRRKTYSRSRWRFQCSSASRKFLNTSWSNSIGAPTAVSVLFSEPKIPQSTLVRSEIDNLTVSVLFSEPKIPQSGQKPNVESSS